MLDHPAQDHARAALPDRPWACTSVRSAPDGADRDLRPAGRPRRLNVEGASQVRPLPPASLREVMTDAIAACTVHDRWPRRPPPRDAPGSHLPGPAGPVS